ncbi:hypothetical protein DLP05_098 [Stenotrophomonas phage vB_SmaS_DLP_5]|uniref:Uncharacterized protein n=1 Tax=Stenotrophomonas phage vB_SmaS_DLP_5 TaxID=2044561 RepID=A0A2D2W2L7_9CAUD|nr:hypothetical protein FDJ07_gp123 [Stenotrophomonas phage vB_SmaS_DLP_5]ATS92385.1 hypothetical protein DLP05_098 [Stenotrophomonas phage vB_SmaS_DLP_5]
MKALFKNPVFVVALIASVVYLVFGLSIFFGPHSGLLSWILGGVIALVIAALWVAVYKGATTYSTAKDAVDQSWDDLRDRIDKGEK